MTITINMHQRNNEGGTISARQHDYANAPLKISFCDDDGTIGEVTFFVDNDAYVRALVAAINSVKPTVKAEIAEAAE